MRRPFLVLIVVAVAVSAFAQRHTVTRVVAVVNPRVANGPCPATLTFTGTIFVSHHPVEVTYNWLRSDGARGPRQRVVIRSAGQGVTDTWQLGRRRERLTVWEKLHIIAPTGMTSAPAVARVNCR